MVSSTSISVRKSQLEVISEEGFTGLSPSSEYLLPFWGLAILVIIGFAINAATEVSVAKLLEKIINAIQERDQSFTTLFPLLVIALMFFRGLGTFYWRLLYSSDFT